MLYVLRGGIMTDRELLELAAKAAGYPHEWHGEIQIETDHEPRKWNPLTDDGDALRLAVTLQLDIEFLNGDTHVLNACEGGPDKLAQTRRAIVLAAAEIGKGMP